jgi:hypothetical protein
LILLRKASPTFQTLPAPWVRITSEGRGDLRQMVDDGVEIRQMDGIR